jgi:type II secretory pathway component GspD/PulD (secretin)
LRARLVAFIYVTLIVVLSGPRAFGTVSEASVVVHDQPLRSVLSALGKRFDATIVVGEDISGSVTVSLHDATLEQALSAVLGPLHYRFVKRDGSYIVSRVVAQAPVAVATPGPQPVVLNVTLIPVDRAAGVLKVLYPKASIHVDHASGALIVSASSDDVNGMRAILQGIDVKDPRAPVVAAVQVQYADPETLAERLRALYPGAQITLAAKHGILLKANPQDMDQIKQLISTVDQPPTPPSPPPAANTEAVQILQSRPQDVARTVAHEFPHLRAAVAGSTVVLSGDPNDITQAKALIAQIDVPPVGSRFLQVYHLHNVDAASVADLLMRSFSNAEITVDNDLNAISVFGTNSEQERIADAITQLDAVPNSGQQGGSSGAGGTSNLEIVTLRSALPAQSGSTGTDPTQAIVQTVQQLVPNVKIAQLATPGQLALVGDPYSLRQAKEELAELDIPPPLVVLDTEILEIDESVAKTLGLQLPTSVGTTYSEVIPPALPNGNAQPIGNFLPLTRTPLSQLQVTLNLLVQNGSGRVLSDPRLTTLSGHTASIRAGDQISILTTTGGGTGTVATQQLQTFQTGVTLDITPLVTSDSTLTITLHPVVNSVDGSNGGVPQIATREVQTTVSLGDNQTLVIGGLIQDTVTRTVTSVPVLGNLPLVGSLFRNNQLVSDHNELVIVVTPHIVRSGEPVPPPQASLPLPSAPVPEALPTLPPGTELPSTREMASHGRRSTAHSPVQPSSATPAAAPNLQGTATPTPLPSAQVFTYGSLPPTNFAQPNDPVKIYQATVSPTTVQNGTPIKIGVVTSTNTSKVTVSYGSTSTTLGQAGPGMWQGVLPFSTATEAAGQANIALQITAARLDGSSTQITVPLTVSQ